MWDYDQLSTAHNFNDPRLVKITSNHQFYDMFLVIKEKLRLRINETVILKKGIIYAWLFTGKPKKGSVVLKKKPSNTNIIDFIVKHMPIPPKKHYDSLFQLMQYIDTNSTVPPYLTF